MRADEREVAMRDRPSRDRAAIDDLRAEVARLRDMCRVVVVALLLAWGTLAWLVNR